MAAVVLWKCGCGVWADEKLSAVILGTVAMRVWADEKVAAVALGTAMRVWADEIKGSGGGIGRCIVEVRVWAECDFLSLISVLRTFSFFNLSVLTCEFVNFARQNAGDTPN